MGNLTVCCIEHRSFFSNPPEPRQTRSVSEYSQNALTRCNFHSPRNMPPLRLKNLPKACGFTGHTFFRCLVITVAQLAISWWTFLFWSNEVIVKKNSRQRAEGEPTGFFGGFCSRLPRRVSRETRREMVTYFWALLHVQCLLSVGRGICACWSAGYRGIQRASGTQKT